MSDQALTEKGAEKEAYMKCRKHYKICISSPSARHIKSNGRLSIEVQERYDLSGFMTVFYGCEAEANITGIE
jgi:hypothetical protein